MRQVIFKIRMPRQFLYLSKGERGVLAKAIQGKVGYRYFAHYTHFTGLVMSSN